MSYKIITDTSANLPLSFCEENDLSVIPLSYRLNGTDCICTDLSSFEAKAYYDALRQKAAVTTSLASIQSFLDCFKKELKAGNDVLYIGMSSGISGTFHSAAAAAAELEERFPDRKLLLLDTRAASLGEGLFVMEAVRLRKEGKTIDEVYEALLRKIHEIVQIFTVEDLGHLHRGGRISGVTAVIGSVLHINPILMGQDGTIRLAGKVRGRKKALLSLVECYRKDVIDPENQTVCIAHCDCPGDAQFLAEEIRKVKEPESLMIEPYEPVTGSHVGPGAIALFFTGKQVKPVTDA